MYRSRIHDVVAKLKSRLMEELQHFNQMIINEQSGSGIKYLIVALRSDYKLFGGIHVVELAFEHAENILNTNFNMFDFAL